MNLYSGRVTVNDIRHAHERALATSPDPDAVQRNFDQIVADVGGIEELARQWNRANLLTAFSQQIRGEAAAPAAPLPSNPANDRKRLRELIERFPELAREILGDDV